jgi:hypothetical protein
MIPFLKRIPGAANEASGLAATAYFVRGAFCRMSIEL